MHYLKHFYGCRNAALTSLILEMYFHTVALAAFGQAPERAYMYYPAANEPVPSFNSLVSRTFANASIVCIR